MNCPNCGNPVSLRKRTCETCGYDLSTLRYLKRLSNAYYNLGLEKARVRDLSGAIVMLNRSLDAYKKNIDARNLLGLCYYETGEIVSALSAWVISKSYNPSKDNLADYYINTMQVNPNRLEACNQAIRKYNIALDSAKSGSDDLAIIQLKKVVELNPKFVKALLLLGLLYIKSGDNRRAMRYLKAVTAIDVANTTALRYIAEIEASSSVSQGESGRLNEAELEKSEKGKGISPAGSYREDKPNRLAFINLIVGVIIGVLVVYYLIVPTARQNALNEYKSNQVDYSGELASKSAKISQLEKQLSSLEKTAAEQKTRLDEYAEKEAETVVEEISYDSLFAGFKAYFDFEEIDDYSDDELIEAAIKLKDADTTGITDENALSLLADIRTKMYKKAAKTTYKKGKSAFEKNDYEEAIRLLSGAVEFDPESDSAIYYLGKSYQAAGDYDNAAYYYKHMLEVCPNSALKQYIPQRLNEIGRE